jgi:ribosomal protein S18 acetylase RimI-like enzyme
VPSARYEALDARHPEWGNVAELPWELENFGFVVGDWRPGDLGATGAARDAVQAAIVAWAASRQAQLVSARVGAGDETGRLVLGLLGFQFIHCSIDAEIADLRKTPALAVRHAVRPAVTADHPELIRIAGESFLLDRYHADARFPPALAERRHRRWMQGLLESAEPGFLTYVVGAAGRPHGLFSAIVSADGSAEIQLAAVDPARQGQGIGTSVFAGALNDLRGRGVGRCYGKFYAANTPIMNVFGRSGFRFVASQALYHWHAPASQTLRSLQQIFGR